MKALLFNENPAISRLITLSMQKLGVSFKEISDESELVPTDLLIIDGLGGCSDERAKELSPRIIRLIGKDESPLRDNPGVNYLSKPFLPTDFNELAQSLLAGGAEFSDELGLSADAGASSDELLADIGIEFDEIDKILASNAELPELPPLDDELGELEELDDLLETDELSDDLEELGDEASETDEAPADEEAAEGADAQDEAAEVLDDELPALEDDLLADSEPADALESDIAETDDTPKSQTVESEENPLEMDDFKLPDDLNLPDDLSQLDEEPLLDEPQDKNEQGENLPDFDASEDASSELFDASELDGFSELEGIEDISDEPASDAIGDDMSDEFALAGLDDEQAEPMDDFAKSALLDDTSAADVDDIAPAARDFAEDALEPIDALEATDEPADELDILDGELPDSFKELSEDFKDLLEDSQGDLPADELAAAQEIDDIAASEIADIDFTGDFAVDLPADEASVASTDAAAETHEFVADALELADVDSADAASDNLPEKEPQMPDTQNAKIDDVSASFEDELAGLDAALVEHIDVLTGLKDESELGESVQAAAPNQIAQEPAAKAPAAPNTTNLELSCDDDIDEISQHVSRALGEAMSNSAKASSSGRIKDISINININFKD